MKRLTYYTTKDFAATRGQLLFADGPGSRLSRTPSPLHLNAWNRRVGLPPVAVAAYFADSLKRVGAPSRATVPRIIFSASPRNGRNPVMLFELWPKAAELPKHYSRDGRQRRIARATFVLDANRVYFDWINVTRDFENAAGKKNSLRGQGIGRRMLATIIPLFMAMEYDRVDLAAQSHGPNKGAYVWPRFGFEVAEKSRGIKTGLDQLPARLQQKFKAAADTLNLPAGIARNIGGILRQPEPRMLIKLTDIRHRIADPDRPGAETQVAEYLLRKEYILGSFRLTDAQWQEKFFTYVGEDTRPALAQQLRSARQKSPS